MSEFHWTSPAGVEVTLPKMGNLKGGLLRRFRKLDPVDFMFSVLENSVSEDELEILDDLDMDDLNALFEAWQGATPGESSGSST